MSNPIRTDRQNFMSKIIRKQPEKSDIIPGVGPSENGNHNVIEDDKQVNNDKSQNDGHQDSLRSSEAGVRSSPCLPRQSQPPGPEAAATTPLARVTRQPMTPLARVTGQHMTPTIPTYEGTPGITFRKTRKQDDRKQLGYESESFSESSTDEEAEKELLENNKIDTEDEMDFVDDQELHLSRNRVREILSAGEQRVSDIMQWNDSDIDM